MGKIHIYQYWKMTEVIKHAQSMHVTCISPRTCSSANRLGYQHEMNSEEAICARDFVTTALCMHCRGL